MAIAALLSRALVYLIILVQTWQALDLLALLNDSCRLSHIVPQYALMVGSNEEELRGAVEDISFKRENAVGSFPCLF